MLQHRKNVVSISTAIYFLFSDVEHSLYAYTLYFSLDMSIFYLFLGGLCQIDAACTHWTWIDKTNSQLSWGYNYCFLKSSDSGEKSLSGVVSGTKDCPFQGDEIFEVEPIGK